MTMIKQRWPRTGWITCILALVILGLTGGPASAENKMATPAPKSATAPNDQSADTANAQPDKRIKRDFGFYEPEPLDFNEHQGFVQIFDGVSLKNWDGDPNTWHVEDGAIVGESTKEKPVANSYISFHGCKAKDFDLKFEIRVENGGG